MDVLVRESDEQAALEAVTKLGYSHPRRYRYARVPSLSKMALPLHLQGTHHFLEIHSNIITAPTSVEVEELFTNAVKEDVAGISVITLTPIDFLLHLIAHAAEHHQFEIGLSCLLDVSLFLRHHSIDGAQLRLRAERTRKTKSVDVVLSLAAAMLNSSIPVGWNLDEGPGNEELKHLVIAQLWHGSQRPLPFGILLLSRPTLPLVFHATIKRLFTGVSSTLAGKGRRGRLTMVSPFVQLLFWDGRKLPKIFDSWRRGHLSWKSVQAEVSMYKKRDRIRVLLNAGAIPEAVGPPVRR